MSHPADITSVMGGAKISLRPLSQAEMDKN
jgi:hypothetical protein